MISLGASMIAHLSEPTTTLATCWKVTLQNGTIYRLTDHDVSLQIPADGNETYSADSSFLASDFAGSGNLAVDGIDIHSWIDTTVINEQDVYAGLWDNARVEIFAVNHQDTSIGVIPLKTGNIGAIKYGDGPIVLEMRSLAQQLQVTTTQVFQFTCRASVYDDRCGVPKASHLVATATVSGTPTRTVFDTGETLAEGELVYGTAEWLTGNNAGLAHDIVSHTTGGEITLELPAALAIQAGDTCELYRGCDKTRATCRDRFGNIPNFRAEPDQPTPDEVIYPVRSGGGGQ